MKCKKCGKEYNDEFLFCPFCGAKKRIANDQVSVPTFLCISVMDDSELENLAAEMQEKSGEEIKRIYHRDCYIPVFVVRGEVEREENGKWKSWELIKTTPWLKEGPYTNVRFYIEKKQYTRYMFPYVGRSVFRTEEEARKTITDAGYTREEDGRWYSTDG